MAATKKLRLGFLGLGQATSKLLARRHEIEGLPYVIAAAADLRPHAREAFAAEFGAQTFDSAEGLCASDIDVIYIATPAEFHREHVEIAARAGKHIICEKPLALSLADCEAMIAACDAAGVKLLAGHTHSFDAPIREMRRTIRSGEIGDLVMLNTWNFNDFNHRGRLVHELQTTHGPILNQGPHHVDVVRQLGGGMVKTVMAKPIWDSLSRAEGGYICFLEFENGVPATLVYDGRSQFDTSELFWWTSEGGLKRPPDTNAKARKSYRAWAGLDAQQMADALEKDKESGRYGAAKPKLEKEEGPPPFQPFFGLTVVSCDKGSMRQSQDGIIVYGEEGPREVVLERSLRGRAAELSEMYGGVMEDRPIFHDGRWAMATLEVCQAILDSAKASREIRMMRQVPTND
ncbi:MAG TPA: Gfo/Idh/MocA family oxidoreductase [Alphaproteobacteria bacterium]|jgi:predicted dehydrogenase